MAYDGVCASVKSSTITTYCRDYRYAVCVQHIPHFPLKVVQQYRRADAWCVQDFSSLR